MTNRQEGRAARRIGAWEGPEYGPEEPGWPGDEVPERTGKDGSPLARRGDRVLVRLESAAGHPGRPSLEVAEALIAKGFYKGPLRKFAGLVLVDEAALTRAWKASGLRMRRAGYKTFEVFRPTAGMGAQA